VPSSYIEQALVTLLRSSSSSSEVYAELGKKVFFAEAEAQTAKPYAVLHTVSDPHVPFAFGEANSGQPRTQISVYDDARFNAMEIAHKIRKRLRFYSGSMDGITVRSLTVGGTVLLRDPDENVYQASIDVLPIYIDAS